MTPEGRSTSLSRWFLLAGAAQFKNEPLHITKEQYAELRDLSTTVSNNAHSASLRQAALGIDNFSSFAGTRIIVDDVGELLGVGRFAERVDLHRIQAELEADRVELESYD